ncbi:MULTISPECIES: hypothetical protein [Mycobacterium]|uniref:Uncharacterized protein n=2 Tax=Mycobacterium TaxID=1763 RepID=A0AA37V8A1_9MYCO|nr:MULTISPECIES: hypothetical protein [Mycobacterium]ASX03469.1 hypothetical protein CKJ58_25910 [Mycobacterium intracellulare subsp. chimaera]PBA61252.1 hypothetical protein CKJ56_12880 [Mycobacterium intracellulare subsp. chimaera]QWY63710.1 hypothetical protein BJP74_24310 [Mycobacterium avium subsp. hominissuis]QWY65103.1 hypothetical protein BJP78_25225 [Mycobacterium avium subsp. hominissuis]BAN91896.1 hypothetical protein MAH_p64 [Mycobacterium avium subsp. hominissuis TH135]
MSQSDEQVTGMICGHCERAILEEVGEIAAYEKSMSLVDGAALPDAVAAKLLHRMVVSPWIKPYQSREALLGATAALRPGLSCWASV